MEDLLVSSQDLVHLARLATAGDERDISLFVRRLARKVKNRDPKLAKELSQLVRQPANSRSALRDAAIAAMPVDEESRLHLARFEHPVSLEAEPIWHESIQKGLSQVIVERANEDDLIAADLVPTRTLLFTGPPGVGKTLAARFLARELDRPLIVLDLSAVMSSFLGRTGNNLRNVLDYARGHDCVLLLDEFDAIAKRRDDAVEVGELKRLVTVLLQEIDRWPHSGILIGATNHEELLDPAVWRRFDLIVKFLMPSDQQVQQLFESMLGGVLPLESDKWISVAPIVLGGLSFSDIRRDLNRVRRESVVSKVPFDDAFIGYVRDAATSLTKSGQIDLAVELTKAGCTQHQAHEYTGVSRDTIRKHSR